MSSIIKVNKDGLSSSSSTLVEYSTSLSNTISDLSEVLSSIPSHDEFTSLKSKVNLLSNSLSALDSDMKNISTNIKTYVDGLIEIDNENITDVDFSSSSHAINASDTTTTDTSSSAKDWSSTTSASTYYGGNSGGNYTYSYSTGPSGVVNYVSSSSSNNWGTVDTSNAFPGKEYNYEGIEKYVEDIDGTTVTLPAGLGSVHTYMGWQCITATSSTQYKLREVAGMNFDDDGFAKIGDRYVVATTTTFGKVGDYIDVYQEDGTVIKCVIGDIKNQNDAGCNEWGHNNGQCVVEFVVDKSSWYGTNKTITSFHPEFNKNITKIVNKGNYFDLIQTDAAKLDNTTTESSSDDSTSAVQV